MPIYVTPEQLRRLQGGAEPRTAAPRVKAPRRPAQEPPDAGEAAQEPYRAAGWLFVQLGRDLLCHAYNRHTGRRVGPTSTWRALLQDIGPITPEGEP